MIDIAMIAVGSVLALGLLMFVCAARVDLVLWVIDTVEGTWRKVRG